MSEPKIKSMPLYIINPIILKQLSKTQRISVSKYMILDYIFHESYYWKKVDSTPDRSTKYCPIKAVNFHYKFALDNSVISKYLKQLVAIKYLEREIFGYCLSKNIESLFMENRVAREDNLVLSFHYYYFPNVNTPEQIIIMHYLIKTYYNNKKPFILSEVNKQLPFSILTIKKVITKSYIIKQIGNKLVFSSRLILIYKRAENNYRTYLHRELALFSI